MEKRREFYSETFNCAYKDDYIGYREFIYKSELEDLIVLFEKPTKFYFFGEHKQQNRIISTIEGILPNSLRIIEKKEDIFEYFNPTDVFVVPTTKDFNILNSLMLSENKNNMTILDIEGYMTSLDPAKIYFESLR